MKFKLLSTETVRGAINVPIFWAMSNEDMAKAIEQEFELNREDFVLWTDEHTSAMQNYLRTLLNEPGALFIDPCLGECEDSFVCAFGVEEHKE